MRFKADEIASVIEEEIRKYRTEVDLSEVGKVLEVGDGIARVYGLPGVMAGEMVEFANGAQGQAFNLEESSVGVIILGDYLGIKEGDEVRRSRRAALRARRRGADRPRRRPAGQAARRQGPDRDAAPPAARIERPRHRRAPAGRRAAADRHQGHRRHDPRSAAASAS